MRLKKITGRNRHISETKVITRVQKVPQKSEETDDDEGDDSESQNTEESKENSSGSDESNDSSTVKKNNDEESPQNEEDEDDDEEESKPVKQKQKRKTKRAPGAPSVPLSAYMFFCSEKRNQVRKSLPEDAKGTEIMKALGALWRTLNDGQKETYNKLAAADKERYARELETYDGPMKVPIKRAKKEPGGPTQARSAFNFYQIHAREGLKEKYPDKTPLEISKMVTSSWGIMTDDEKAPYRAMASDDKQRYIREQQESLSNQMNNAAIDNSNDDEKDDHLEPPSKKKKDKNAPRKPRTAFNFYQSKARPTVKERNPKSSPNEISSFVADCWNRMDPRDKKPFEALAIQDKKRYQEEMEAYEKS